MTTLSEFVLFVLVGGLAALVNILARLLFSTVTPFEVAVVLAFPIALTAAFVLNRRFVFKVPKGNIPAEYGRFLLVNLVALIQVFAVSVLLARIVFPWFGLRWHAETIAHVIGVLSPVVTSYVLHRAYTFGPSREVPTAPTGKPFT